MNGAELIAAERHRQVTAEGWTPEHDAEHTQGELVLAAVCYAGSAAGVKWPTVHPLWPWADEWWKPTPEDPMRSLVKAGALIAAEIDRLTNAAQPSEGASA